MLYKNFFKKALTYTYVYVIIFIVKGGEKVIDIITKILGLVLTTVQIIKALTENAKRDK